LILIELTGSESDPAYQALEISNGNRQYDFLNSIVNTCITIDRAFLSTQIIKSLNYHAITCLHTNAGEYRPCQVIVGNYTPPDHYRVDALMDDFVNVINRSWETADPVVLASYALWRLNHIHPFINGNGRTARATCYFILCMKVKAWLQGTTILPELIKQNRAEYVKALEDVDATLLAGKLDLSVLHVFLSKLLNQQLASVPAAAQQATQAP